MRRTLWPCAHVCRRVGSLEQRQGQEQVPAQGRQVQGQFGKKDKVQNATSKRFDGECSHGGKWGHKKQIARRKALKGKGGSTTGAVGSGASSSAALRKRSRSIGQRAGSTPRPPRGSATKCQHVVYDPGSDELVKLSAVGNTHGGFDAPVSFDAGMARSRAFSKIGRKKNAGAEASHSRGSWREEPEDLPPTKVVTNDADVPIIYGMAQMASKVTRSRKSPHGARPC